MSQLSGKKLTVPKHVIIEKTALELAACFYEIGRSQGLVSKWPDARSYAKANLENFIPKSVEILTDMLSLNHISKHIKDEISDALIERANDPDLAFLSAPKPVNDIPDHVKRQIENSFGIGAYSGKETKH